MAYRPVSDHADFRLPAGTFDVRGWDVRTRVDGERVGEVADILIDESGEIRYLDVELGRPGKHVLVPVNQAKVDPGEDAIWVLGMTRDQIREIPAYSGDVGRVEGEYEALVARGYGATDARMRPRGAAGRATSRARRSPGREPAGEGRLATLSALRGARIVHGDPDPRRWAVVAADGRRVGRVRDLVVDTIAMKVRHLVCDLSDRAAEGSGARAVLLPAVYVRLDGERRLVLVDALESDELTELPRFEGLPVGSGYEEAIYARFTQGEQLRRGRGGEDR